ncbi:MAG: oligosaccharide flippase family protein [Candidatus Eisenbacteria bacterium]|nr:oligosaccharide flippase family protein [Candidatus Eisenbacteria bacterium]
MRPGEIVHSVSRGAFYLALEKVAALLSGVAYFALLLRWLGPTKYGMMALATSFTGLATMATGNFEMFLERYAAEYEARGMVLTLRRAHLMALGLKLGLGLVASALILALAPVLAGQFATPELTVLLPLLVFTVAFDGFSTTGRATLYGAQQFRWVSMLAIVFHVTKTLMVGALWFAHQGLVALAVGLSALTVAQGLAQTAVPMWMMRRAEDREPGGPETRGRGLFRAMLGYCLPLLGARVTFMSGQNLSKIILGKLFTTTQLGYFSFAFQTIERFVEVAHTLPSALLPPLTRLVATGERDRLRSVFDQSLRLVQVVACGLSFTLFAFARELTLFIGSPLFEPAWPILRVLALVPVARTAQQPLTMLFQAARRPATVLGLALVKFVTEFGCYFLLVTSLGIIGGAWANLAGATVSYLVAMAVLARVLPGTAGPRARTALTALGLLLPLLALALLADARAAQGAATLVHLLLVPAGGVGVFALGLVRRYDLQRVAEMPLQTAWMRRVRDVLVGTVDRFARVVEPRRIP